MKRQASHSFTVDDFLNEVQEGCKIGKNVFDGGLVGKDAICNSTSDDDLYRRIDGVCNNLANKHFGATGIAMRRIVPADYADGKINY